MLMETKGNTPTEQRAALRDLSPGAMADIGLQTHVYVRKVRAQEFFDEQEIAGEFDGQIDVAPDDWLYAVYAANGICVAIVDSRDGAYDGAREFGYEPLSVH